MSNKSVILKDIDGNTCYPKTTAQNVIGLAAVLEDGRHIYYGEGAPSRNKTDYVDFSDKDIYIDLLKDPSTQPVGSFYIGEEASNIQENLITWTMEGNYVIGNGTPPEATRGWNTFFNNAAPNCERGLLYCDISTNTIYQLVDITPTGTSAGDAIEWKPMDQLIPGNGIQINGRTISAKLNSIEDNMLVLNSAGLYAAPSKLPYKIVDNLPQIGSNKYTYLVPKTPNKKLWHDINIKTDTQTWTVIDDTNGWAINTNPSSDVTIHKTTVDHVIDDYLSFTVNAYVGYDTWTQQIRKRITGLNENDEYTIKLVIKSDDPSNGVVLPSNNSSMADIRLNGNVQMITTKYNATNGVMDYCIGFGYTGANVTITIYSILVYDAQNHLVYAGNMNNAYDKYVYLSDKGSYEKISQDYCLSEELPKDEWDLIYNYLLSSSNNSVGIYNLFADNNNKYKKIRLNIRTKSLVTISSSVSVWAVIDSWRFAKNFTIHPTANAHDVFYYTIIFDFENSELIISITPSYGAQYSPYSEETLISKFEQAPLATKSIGYSITLNSDNSHIDEGEITVEGLKW